MRRLEKEGSPVRAFLNTNEDKFIEQNNTEGSNLFLLQNINPLRFDEIKSPTNGSTIEPGEPIPDQI